MKAPKDIARPKTISMKTGESSCRHLRITQVRSNPVRQRSYPDPFLAYAGIARLPPKEISVMHMLSLSTTVRLFSAGRSEAYLRSLSCNRAWDDLGLRFYCKKTDEVQMACSNVGLILPLTAEAVSVASLFWNTAIIDPLVHPIGIVMALSPHVFVMVIHHEFVRENISVLFHQLPVTEVEIDML